MTPVAAACALVLVGGVFVLSGACSSSTEPTSSSSSSGAVPSDSGASSSGDGGTCIRLNGTGCDTLNNPSNCCTNSEHPDVTCNDNNDNKGHAQCCVAKDKHCQSSSDCCGYATNSDLYRCSAESKCTTAF